MLIQGLGLLVLSGILCQIMIWVFRQRAEIRAVEQIASGELVYLRRLTEEAEARTRTQRARTSDVWTGWRKFRVLSVVDETESVKSFYLTPHDRKPLPPFLPGQHVAVQVKPPDRHEPLIRCYSLSSAPNEQFYRISVKREGPRPEQPDRPIGVMSTYLHQSLKDGDFIDLKAPSGSFSLDLSRHTPVVLIGGGIGITPVFSMLDAIVRQKSNREVWFFAGMRNRLDHPLRMQLKAHADQRENVRLVVCYSQSTEDCHPDREHHHRDVVSVDLLRRVLPSNNYDFYFCGPAAMMDSLHDGLLSWGVPAARLHHEAFGPASIGQRTPASNEADHPGSLEIKFLRSGKTLAWQQGGGSLLDLADRHGIRVDSGCRMGNCGTCMTAIRTGEVDYPVPPGEVPDVGACLLCTAVPRSNLELDV